MGQIADPAIDLFAEMLPSLEQIKMLSDYIHSSEKNMMDFGETVETNTANATRKTYTALGIGLYILERNAEAIEVLQKAKDS